MTFAQKLDRLMRRHGESQRALAAALDVSHPSVGAWLKNAQPHRSTALLIAEHYRVNVDDLIDDDRDLPLDVVLTQLDEAKALAGAAYPSNPDAARHAFDYLLEERSRMNNAKELKRLIAGLARVVSQMDPSDEQFEKIARDLNGKYIG